MQSMGHGTQIDLLIIECFPGGNWLKKYRETIYLADYKAG